MERPDVHKMLDLLQIVKMAVHCMSSLLAVTQAIMGSMTRNVLRIYNKKSLWKWHFGSFLTHFLMRSAKVPQVNPTKKKKNPHNETNLF